MPEAKKLPYVTAYGNITKALEKIQAASTPPRFTQDFLATKLAMKGGSARPVIPFLKRIGFLTSDGTPTDLYKQFRGNNEQRGAAAAKALRAGYEPLYESNEYTHNLNENDLKALVVQVTGLEKSSQIVTKVVKSFEALNNFADHDAAVGDVTPDDEDDGGEDDGDAHEEPITTGFNLGYTINLNLPPTSDIAVFDAIFKSLRQHILK